MAYCSRNRRRTASLAVACLLGYVVLADAAEPGPLLAVTTDRVLYDPGAIATFTVTATSKADTDFSGRLEVSARWDMAESKPLLDQPLTLTPGQAKTFPVSWTDLPAVMGGEARAELLDGAGKPLATASEYFNVWPAATSLASASMPAAP